MQTIAIRREALIIRGISKAAISWFVFSLALQLLMMLAIHIFSLNHGFGGLYPLASGHDDGYYYGLASDIARGADAGTLPSFYPRILGALFYFTGPDLIIGKMLNVLAGALAVMVGVLFTRDLAREEALLDGASDYESMQSGERAANIAGFFLTFYPSQLWYSTQLVKDPILVFLGLWALLLAVRFLRQPQFGTGLLWLVVFCGLFVFRSYAAFAMGVAVVLFTVRFRRKWLPLIFILAGVGPLAVGQGLFGWSQIQPWLDTQKLESFREFVYSTGGSAADIHLDYSSPFSFLMTYPYSFATVMFGPFPWQLHSAAQFVALVEAVAVWPLIGLWVKGFIEIWRGKPGRSHQGYTSLLMLFSILLVGSVALFSDNIGANTRLRLLPWCSFLIFSAIRLEGLPIFSRLSLAQFLKAPSLKRVFKNRLAGGHRRLSATYENPANH